MFGYTQEEVIGLNPRFLQQGDNHQDALDVLKRSIKAKESTVVTLRNYHKDGTLIYNELSISPLFNDKGKVKYYLGIQRDVTSSKQVCDQVNYLKDKYFTLFEYSPFPYLITDTDTIGILECNTTTQHLLKTNKQHLLGKSLLDLTTKFQADGTPSTEYFENISKEVHQHKIEHFELRCRDFDGNILDLEVSFKTVQWEGQDAFLMAWKDVTYRKRQETFAKYEQIIKLSPDNLHILDVEGYLVEASQTFAQSLGYTNAEEMIGKHVSEWDSQCDLTLLKELIERPSKLMTTHSGIDGQKTEVETHTSPLKINNQIYIYASSHDITLQIEAQRHENERQRYQKLLNLSSDAIFIMDPMSGKLLEYSHLTQAYLGYSDEEMKTLWVGDWDKEIQTPEQFRMIGEMIHQSRPLKFERLHTRKDGSTYLASMTAVKFFLDSQEVVYASVRDITEARRMENELHENQLRWRFAIDGSGDGLWDWNMEDSSVYFSPQWKQMLGFEKYEISNTLEEWSSRVHPDQIDGVYADINNYLEGRSDTYRNEHMLLCKNGEYKWVLDRGMIVKRDEEGKPLRMIGMHTDIDEAKKLNEALSTSNAIIDQERHKFSSLFHNSPDAYFLLELKGFTIIDCNKATETILNGSREQIIGLTPDVVSPEFQESGETSKDKALRMIEIGINKGINRFKWQHQKFTGEIFWVEVILSKVRIDKEDILFVAWRDITQQKHLEKDLLAAKDQADKASVEKSNFLANMSHEIRTPMTGMLGFVEQLQKNETDPQKKKQLDIIKSSGNTLLNIINDILDFSKIESGKMIIEKAPLDLMDVFNQSSLIFHELFNDKGLNFVQNLDKNLPAFILGDEIRLKQILFNLLSNALKFTPAKGTVSIEAKLTDEHRLFICVKDTGIGIAPEKLGGIFESFKQADSSTTRKFGGTGLGLSISSKLVEKMEGQLKVESTLDAGSRFYFEIPITLIDTPHVNDAETFEDNARDGHIDAHVLIVEDNKTNQLLLSIILEEAGISHEIAEDGVIAVERYRQNAFDLILMDENMPNLNGIGATKQIRQIEADNKAPGVPIIAVTANALKEDEQRFKAAGMDGYISKPFEEKALLAVLRKHLKRSAC